MATTISTDSTDYIAALQENSSTSGYASSQQLGQADFLRLLTTQLQNQDPNDPMDPTDFVTDLTQMSQLEATNSLNASVLTMTEGFQNLQTMQAATLIGKSVQAEGEDFSHTAGAESTFRLNAAEDLEDVKIVISNDDGIVTELEVGDMAAGEEAYSWDGIDQDGLEANSGVYSLTVYGTNADGDLKSIDTVVATKVNSVGINTDGTMTLTLATGEQVDMAAVREISE